VDHEDARRLQPIFPGPSLAGRDPQGEEVETGCAVAPGARWRRLVRALEGEEPLPLLAHREPDAPVAAAVPRPAPDHREPQHVPVEALAPIEVGALDGEVVIGERHARRVTPAARRANGRAPRLRRPGRWTSGDEPRRVAW